MQLFSNIFSLSLRRKANWISHSEKKLPPSWCHWRTDDGSERSRKKKKTAPRWFEKQKKILGDKGGSWRSKKMETTVYQSTISIFHKSLDLLISSILNNNNLFELRRRTGKVIFRTMYLAYQIHYTVRLLCRGDSFEDIKTRSQVIVLRILAGFWITKMGSTIPDPVYLSYDKRHKALLCQSQPTTWYQYVWWPIDLFFSIHEYEMKWETKLH